MSSLLANVDFEVIPLKGVEEKASLLPKAARVSVTASPAKGLDPTIQLAVKLQRQGFRANPHLSARMVKDRRHLKEILNVLSEAGISRALVVGGDATDSGPFSDALALLRELDDVGHHFSDLGIAGYPEGHPFISDDLLRKALIDKQRYAHYITTQMCFAPETIVSWLRSLRREGIELPVRVGIPGVIEPLRLARIAARIGVGTSARYVMKNRGLLFRLLRPGAYRPTRLLKALNQADGDLGLVGLHIFTFNQIGPTVDWVNAMTSH